MELVTIYGRMSCGFCVRARQLCEARGFAYRFVDMIAEGISKGELSEQLGRPVVTVPQILVGQQYVGGCDDFFAYVRQLESVAG